MVWKYSVLFLPRLRCEQFGQLNRVGAMVLGAVPCDQHLAVEDPHGIQPAALVQLGHDIGEHRVEQGRFDRIEHGADLAVAGDLAACRTVSRSSTGREPVSRCRWCARKDGLCMKNGAKAAEREIGHGVGRVLAAPPVGQGLAVTAQRGDQAIWQGHRELESRLPLRENRQLCS